MTQIKSTKTASVAGKNGFSLISDAKFREIYEALLRCRILDEKLRAHRDYERWPGREAGTAGVITCLQAGDSVTPTSRSVLAEYLLGKNRAVSRDSSPDANLAAATGEALRHKLEKKRTIAVVFTNTGEPKRMRDIFASADSLALPILYAIEGGGMSADIAGSIPVIRVDGLDTVGVYRVAHESITRAREGGGPTIIEYAEWLSGDDSQDSLVRLEAYLSHKKLFRRDWKARLTKKYGEALSVTPRKNGLC